MNAMSIMLPAIIAPEAHQNGIGYEHSQTLEATEDGTLHVSVEVDTEFTHIPLNLTDAAPSQLSPTITAQCRGIDRDKGVIFAHPDIAPAARHPVYTSGFVVVDYLRQLGHDVTIDRQPRKDDLPWIQINLYAFFAVSELLRVVTDDYREDLLKLCLDAESKGRGIAQGRRLRTFTRIKGHYLDWVALPWHMTIDGTTYRVRLAWYDTSAVHGAVGYAAFCQNTNTPIPYKDVFDSADKADMLRMYLERPEDFDNYALGDLYNHRALMNNIEEFKAIYNILGLGDYFRNPRLTTGATIRDLVEAHVGKIFACIHPGKEMREIVNAYCNHGTASVVKMMIGSTAAYNAKVDGGRCRNNRPTHTIANGVICDLDISSCYGEGLRGQLYPLGVPVIIDYPVASNYNSYMTLRQFLKQYGKELVPGLWQARVSTGDGYRLKYPQDNLMSWFPPRDISKMPTDTDLAETDEWWSEDNVGTLKVHTHQVHLALINHDFIQWLDYVASPRQRNELLDNLRVVTAMYYPASERVSSIEILRHAHDTHEGRNTCTVKKIRGVTTKISIHQECHKWYGITLGEMFITKLLQERNKHKKKTPMNELMKLCINTTYGDMVSPFFGIGNVVVGNNITARARSLAWYMEKGLHGWQTITDGCAFDVNNVLHHGKVKANGENLVGLHRESSRHMHLVFKPLDNVTEVNLIIDNDQQPGVKIQKSIDIDSIDEIQICLDSESSQSWVNRAAMEHLQNMFPDVDVLHSHTTDVEGNFRKGQFAFEAKGFYDRAVFHGTANYAFFRQGKLIEVKMRSYSKKPQERMTGEGLEIDSEEYLPAKSFLTNLSCDSVNVVRQSSYLKASIQKVGDFSRHYDHRYEKSKVFPGMTVKKASLLREFSLAQFTYENIDQYRTWERESEGLRRRYGQSYEMYFLNPEGTLNYQLMVETIDRKISQGLKGFWDGVSRREKNAARQQHAHISLATLENTRAALSRYYGFVGHPSFEDEDAEIDDGEFGANDYLDEVDDCN